MNTVLFTESILRRDRIIVSLSLFALTALAWLYLYDMAQNMAAVKMDGAVVKMAMTTANGADFSMTFVMWAVMMVGMMLPSAAPMILTFALVNRKRFEGGKTFVPTGIFLSAYLFCWTLFSFIAAGAQTTLYRMSWLNPNDQTVTPIIGASLLIAAGLFQLSALKNICLKHCTNPLDFLGNEWRDGYSGAFTMGLKHGIFCIGCCWMLMALLFVAGVMNFFWIAALSIFVLAEKVLPWRNQIVNTGAGGCLISGIILLIWGLMNGGA